MSSSQFIATPEAQLQPRATSDKVLLLNDCLVISDIHLGKVSHFRKAGYAIPNSAVDANYQLMETLIVKYAPRRVVFLGDLFHSDINHEWAVFEQFLANEAFSCEWILVEGNHDILNPELYKRAGLKLMSELEIESFLLTHEPMSNVPEGFVNIHGHIHPGVRLKGKARQRLSVPCFHYRHPYLCVPAFGALTGLVMQKIRPSDQCLAIVADSIVEVEKNTR